MAVASGDPGGGWPGGGGEHWQARGVDVVAEVLRLGDPVPPMFWFRDPTGHTLMVVQS